MHLAIISIASNNKNRRLFLTHRSNARGEKKWGNLYSIDNSLESREQTVDLEHAVAFMQPKHIGHDLKSN